VSKRWVHHPGDYATINSYQPSDGTLRSYTLDKTGEQLGDAEVNQCNEVWARERKLLVWQLLGLPLGVLLLGIMLTWVIRGFRLKE
jgi:hypothetical protein